jgi:hypothetical protein
MDWLAQNWIWILFAVAFVAMHMFGHGGHGGHGSDQGGRRDASAVPAGRPEGSSPMTPANTRGPHQH